MLGVDVANTGGTYPGFKYDYDNTSAAFHTAADKAQVEQSYLWKRSRGRAIEIAGEDGLTSHWWRNTPKYIVSLITAFWGKGNANFSIPADNTTLEKYYHYLPKVDDGTNYSHIDLFEAIDAGTIKGLMCWGQNPAVGGPSAKFEREALGKLDWLVCSDLWETETAAFWKRPGVDSTNIGTEVWMLPAAASYEKEGSITNSGRWGQWRYKALEPPEDAKDDLWMIGKLVEALKGLYTGGTDIKAATINELSWDFGSYDHPDPNKVAEEINGYKNLDTTPEIATSFGQLAFDGTTYSGNWLYCGSHDTAGNNKMKNQTGAALTDNSASGIGLFSNWCWSWPVNRRIIYNRNSLNPASNYDPWMPTRWVVKRNAANTAWESGGDILDGGWAPADKYPFIMKPEGVGRLFGMGLADGPFAEHYEPVETPLTTNPITGVAEGTGTFPGNRGFRSPTFFIYTSLEIGTNTLYPIVCSTYRLVEHWQAGAMTRNLPWLVELQPQVFCEMSEELAAAKGIANGTQVRITTARGHIQAIALVTKRFKPFILNGQTVHQVGIPWHFGYQGFGTGDSANILTPNVGDSNTRIPEYKAFLCNVERV
jgi:formate dehydrogenase major subunit